MSTANQRARRGVPLIALLSVGVLAMTGCGGSSSEGDGGGGGSTAEAGTFTYLGQNENTTIVDTLETLAGDQCSTENEAAKFTPDAIPGATWDQQLQLLAGQEGLSDFGMAAGTPSLMKQFIESGQVQDISTELEEMGIEDKILPAAASTIQALHGTDKLYALPTEFNIEGFWYNKQLLEDNGITPPETWDELVDAAAKLQAAGIQPFSASGEQGWPVTRLVGNYLMRDLGPDALQKVAEGEAKLTDPEYVKAADEVAALGQAGYFGDAPTSIDYDTSLNLFMTGKAAFLYMGSWATTAFNDEAQNKIGVDNVGFFSFPDVDGGKGSSDQVPANVGIPTMFSSKGFDDSTKAWMECIVNNYGDTVLKDSGVVSGFKVENPPADLPETTKLVQEQIANAPSSVLWFEALMTSQATTVSQSNGGGLANGSVSGEQFMKLVQDANQG
ncbi:ABC transporter substrate-binding protein [Arthrobacter sedimenti]|uniref:ABC transporter substrate-binding protein n=1 Tax=Arthrobacter sedimenti TaxID=2694931 RepID=UPI001CDC41E4|nr:extracellular solute-binding protein [Arthrobacter sedimenti]